MPPTMNDIQDCIGSSLAINCCQFGYFLPTAPSRSKFSYENHGWIETLAELAPNTRLRDLVLPGTHNSASATISKWTLFSAVGLCQTVSVHEQLRRGARYLDIRIGGKKNSTGVEDVLVGHGMLRGGPLVGVMEEVDRFLVESSGEFIVMEVSYEGDHVMSAEQKVGVFQLLSSKFGDRMVSKDDITTWFHVNRVTIGEITKRSKNLLVLIHDRICGFTHEEKMFDTVTVANDFSLHTNSRYMKNKWHNTQSTQQLLNRNRNFIAETSSNDQILVNSQFVLTPMPPGGVLDTIKLLGGVTSLRPVSLVRRLYEKDVLERFVRDAAEDRWNIIMLDYIHLCPQLVRFLIGLNSPRTLKIFEATVTNQTGEFVNVMKSILKLIRRDCTLFILNFQRDLGLNFCQGVLTLTYGFGEESVTCDIAFLDDDSECLICDPLLCDNDV